MFQRMAGAVVLALVALAVVIWRNAGALPVALPLIALWTFSPAIAR